MLADQRKVTGEGSLNVRADPAAIGGLAGDLRGSTDRLGATKPAAEADAGPSSAAVSATVAELMRTAAGFAETTNKTADDLDLNKATYASTEDSNVEELGQAGPD